MGLGFWYVYKSQCNVVADFACLSGIQNVEDREESVTRGGHPLLQVISTL